MEQTHFQRELDLEYCRAGMGKRFANYIVDTLVFYILIIMLGMAIGILRPELIPNESDGVMSNIISLICYGLMMFVIEAACHGKSLGKLITKTKAVNVDGSEITFQKAFVRNIIRCIPFNALSAFGTPCNPWHDAWSHTIVIDERKLDLQLRKDAFFSELNVQNQTVANEALE